MTVEEEDENVVILDILLLEDIYAEVASKLLCIPIKMDCELCVYIPVT